MPRGIYLRNQSGWKHTEKTKKEIGIFRKGKPRSEDTKKKISEKLKGHLVSKETRIKIGIAGKGRKQSKEQKEKAKKRMIGNTFGFQKGNTGYWKGKKRSKETIEKIREKNIGRKQSKEEIEKRAKKLRGQKRTKEQRKKIGNGKIGKHFPKLSEAKKGEKNGMWQGGISYNPYSVDWTRSLRIAIRERDKYTCQLCGEKQGDRVFCVHHIDYNKLNSNTNNLITLCNSCHSKTNINREYWFNYFK